MSHLFAALEPESYDREYSDRQILARMLRLLRPMARRVIVVVAALVAGAVAGAGVPYFLSRTVDSLAGESDLSIQVALLVSAGAVSWLAYYVGQATSGRVVQGFLERLRHDTFSSVISKDLAFFDRYPAGSLVSRVVTDTQSFATVLQVAIDVLAQALLVLGMALLLIWVSPPLAGLTLLLAAVIVVVTLLFRWISRKASRREARAIAEVNAYVQEALHGISVARNFRQQQSTAEGLDNVNHTWFRAALILNRLFSGIIPFLITLTGLGTVAVVWFGGQRVADGTLSVGDLFLFVEALALFWFPLTMVASFWNQLQQGLAAGERILALQDVEPTVQATGTEPVGDLAGRIELRSVTFGYTSGNWALENLDLVAPAGQTLALVGHTGAGKSSIIRLIARSYEFQRGELLIDGRDVRSLDLADYRSRLGILPQRPFLLTGTVRDNIALGRQEVTDDEIAAAVRAIADGGWVAGLEQSLDTEVMEGGKNLSTGQRQLIALARVILQDPDILLMDEATSSIDPITDAQVQRGLRDASRGRTTIIIAHRLPTVLTADQIAVVGGGTVLELGPHETLLARGGVYTQLYHEYFGYQSVPVESA